MVADDCLIVRNGERAAKTARKACFEDGKGGGGGIKKLLTTFPRGYWRDDQTMMIVGYVIN